ncbi:hypothetical protein ACIOEZ_27910 [Streptomyces sp. NPDC087866]|uniref:hypothetical protein n=1 Tax=unclassified Streptomyces TaxID=2593676 RepID=UPI0033A29061
MANQRTANRPPTRKRRPPHVKIRIGGFRLTVQRLPARLLAAFGLVIITYLVSGRPWML